MYNGVHEMQGAMVPMPVPCLPPTIKGSISQSEAMGAVDAPSPG